MKAIKIDNPLDSKPLNQFKQIENLQNNFVNDVIEAQEAALKSELKCRLSLIGYEFIDDGDFYDFVSKRITRLVTETFPFNYELRLDFVNDDNPGTLLLKTSNTVNTEYKDGTTTITIS